MKKVVYGLLGLIALLIALVLVGPSFVDWNAHREWIAQEARRAIGRDLIIDGGPTPGGKVSTILDTTTNPPTLIREGTLSRSDLESVLPIQ